MDGVINGVRLVEKFDLTVRADFDPNRKLKVVNDVQAVTEEEKPKAAAQKKIAAYTPEVLRKSNRKARFDLMKSKQRKADVNEIIFEVQSKIKRFKQIALQNSRFAKETGKGSAINISA